MEVMNKDTYRLWDKLMGSCCKGDLKKLVEEESNNKLELETKNLNYIAIVQTRMLKLCLSPAFQLNGLIKSSQIKRIEDRFEAYDLICNREWPSSRVKHFADLENLISVNKYLSTWAIEDVYFRFIQNFKSVRSHLQRKRFSFSPQCVERELREWIEDGGIGWSGLNEDGIRKEIVKKFESYQKTWDISQEMIDYFSKNVSETYSSVKLRQLFGDSSHIMEIYKSYILGPPYGQRVFSFLDNFDSDNLILSPAFYSWVNSKSKTFEEKEFVIPTNSSFEEIQMAYHNATLDAVLTGVVSTKFVTENGDNFVKGYLFDELQKEIDSDYLFSAPMELRARMTTRAITDYVKGLFSSGYNYYGFVTEKKKIEVPFKFN